MNPDVETTPAPASARVLREFVEFVDALDALDGDALDALTAAYANLPSRISKAVAAAAQQACDAAYDAGRITDHDDDGHPGYVIGVDQRHSDLSPLLDRGAPLIVGLAILASDLIDNPTYLAATGWWQAAGGPMPHGTGPRRPPIAPPKPDPALKTSRPTARKPAPQGPARPVKVHGHRHHALKRWITAVMFAAPFIAVTLLGLAFWHAAIEDGTSGNYLLGALTAIAAWLIAIAARTFLTARER